MVDRIECKEDRPVTDQSAVGKIENEGKIISHQLAEETQSY
jgi:hypothetical protein